MRKKAFQAAFPYTIPIFAGFWFLALAYGIYMNANGFSFVYPMLMSMLIYGGSLEFVAVEMLLSPDLFVVGGGVSENADKFMPLLKLRTPMIPAKLLNTAGIVGAAYYAANHQG